MTTDNEQTTNRYPDKHNELFNDLRTYPSQWDVSELSRSNRPLKRKSHPRKTNNETTASTPPAAQEEPDSALVSFSEKNLGSHLDRFDNPDTNHFGAY